MGKEDYYQILGIDRTYPFTDPNDLKKKFRKLSVKLHPDKNPNNPKATENFQKLNTAYNVLSDPQKRMVYNRNGEEGLEQMDRSRGENNDEPKVVHCNMTLAECYTGFTKEVEITTKVLCQKCYGIGGKKDTSVACSKCKAQGVVEEKKQINHPIFGKVTAMTRGECKACSGKGFTFTEKCDCNNGFSELTEKISLKQKKGVFQAIIQFPEKGDENNDGVRGMLVIVVQLQDNTDFKVHSGNRHLVLQKEISVIESLCGVDYTIELPSGKTINIKDNFNIISPESCHLVENEGMPYTDTDMFGDLVITYTVKYPEKLNESDIDRLMKLGKISKEYKKCNVLFTNKKCQYLINHDKTKGRERNLDSSQISNTNNTNNTNTSDEEDNSEENEEMGGMRFNMSGMDPSDIFGAFRGMF